MNKFGAVRTEYAGQVYDSAGEARFARRLDALKAAGRIRDWKRGDEWVLLDAPQKRDRIGLRVDFEVTLPDGRLRCLDFKGVVTREFSIKARLWRAVYPTVPLIIAKEGDDALAVVTGDAPAAGAAGTGGGRRRVPRGAA